MDQGELSLIGSILLVRLKSLGDILLSAPLANALASAYPGARVDYLIDERFRGVTTCFPGVTTEILRPRSAIARAALLKKVYRRYDLAFDLHGTPFAALAAKAAARDRVLGFSGKRAALLYDHKVAGGDPSMHTIESNLELLRPLGIHQPAPARIALSIAEEDIASWRRKLGPRPAILHAGGRFSCKIWPAERFICLAHRLEAEGYTVHFLVGPEDVSIGESTSWNRIEHTAPSMLAPLFGAAELFIGADSGPMHFAAAAGCCLVALFGPSNPSRWRPRSEKAIVIEKKCECGYGIQSGCLHPDRWCIGRITVEEVFAAAMRGRRDHGNSDDREEPLKPRRDAGTLGITG